MAEGDAIRSRPRPPLLPRWPAAQEERRGRRRPARARMRRAGGAAGRGAEEGPPAVDRRGRVRKTLAQMAMEVDCGRQAMAQKEQGSPPKEQCARARFGGVGLQRPASTVRAKGARGLSSQRGAAAGRRQRSSQGQCPCPSPPCTLTCLRHVRRTPSRRCGASWPCGPERNATMRRHAGGADRGANREIERFRDVAGRAGRGGRPAESSRCAWPASSARWRRRGENQELMDCDGSSPRSAAAGANRADHRCGCVGRLLARRLAAWLACWFACLPAGRHARLIACTHRESRRRTPPTSEAGEEGREARGGTRRGDSTMASLFDPYANDVPPWRPRRGPPGVARAAAQPDAVGGRRSIRSPRRPRCSIRSPRGVALSSSPLPCSSRPQQVVSAGAALPARRPSAAARGRVGEVGSLQGPARESDGAFPPPPPCGRVARAHDAPVVARRRGCSGGRQAVVVLDAVADDEAAAGARGGGRRQRLTGAGAAGSGRAGQPGAGRDGVVGARDAGGRPLRRR